MAKYNVKSLNYMAVGENRCFVNMDTELDYTIADAVHFLCAEAGSYGYTDSVGKALNELQLLSHDIALEQGYGKEQPDGFIEKENDVPLTKEQTINEVILKEQKDSYEETNLSHRPYVRLYLSCCTEETRRLLEEFASRKYKYEQSFLVDPAENGKNTFDRRDGHVLNMYDAVDVSMKKIGMHDSQNDAILDTDRHHDIYVPQMESAPLGFCQANMEDQYYNDTLMATSPTEYSPYIFRSDIGQYTSEYGYKTHYDMQLESDKIKTYSLSGDFRHIDDIAGIKRSYIVDLPVDSTRFSQFGKKFDIPEYDDGLVYYSYLHYGKNTLDPLYTTQMSADGEILSGRTYCGIGQTAGRPYVKYYSGDGAMQGLEMIYPVSYSDNQAKHKSNMYSVYIGETGIDTLYGQTSSNAVIEKLDKLKFDINNAVREIAERVQPANTQLFEVKFED